jgi:5-methylcytosine-specific restriction endonuclease McrA
MPQINTKKPDSKRLSGNFKVFNKKGHLMFRCNRHKFDWYLNRNLAIKLDNQSLQLNFEPNGNGHYDDKYFLQEIKLQCSVCGISENLTSHHVVPYAYRKLIKDKIGKRLTDFDVILICRSCHNTYENEAVKLKEKIAKKYGTCHKDEGKLAVIFDVELFHIQRYYYAIIHYGDKIPQYRLDEMQQIVNKYLEQNKLNMEDILNLSTTKNNPNYINPYKHIVDRIKNFDEFANLWRTHFLNVTKAKFLPKGWINFRDRDVTGRLIKK